MKSKAFTLIELLVVVAIIGILAAVGVTTFNGFQEKAKINTTKSNFNMLVKKFKYEMAFCELRGPDEYAFLEARNYGSHNLQCKAMSGSVSWKSDVGSALGYYFGNHMNMKNVLTTNRSFFDTGDKDEYPKDYNLGTIFGFAITNDTINFTVCFQTPCNQSSNRLTETISKN